MSIKEVTYYRVQCDYPGCFIDTEDIDDNYSAFMQAGCAEDSWECSDCQTISGYGTESDRHYCVEHRVPECVACFRLGVLQDSGGDFWCGQCDDSLEEGISL